jgi:hypothetical protein
MTTEHQSACVMVVGCGLLSVLEEEGRRYVIDFGGYGNRFILSKGVECQTS